MSSPVLTSLIVYCYLPHLKSTSKLLFDLDETADLKRFLDGVEEDEGEVRRILDLGFNPTPHALPGLLTGGRQC